MLLALLCYSFLQSEGDCSLTVRDGVANKTARDWLVTSCDIPEYMDPFGRGADTSLIVPKQDKTEEDIIDNSQIRIFVLVKDKPDITISEDDTTPEIRPPWDISTQVNLPPKYLTNGAFNPARHRPGSAKACHHFSGLSSLRPFSAPCGYLEYASWKHPMDVQPFLSAPRLTNFRRYSSVTDLRASERNPIVREKASRLLLSVRSSKG